MELGENPGECHLEIEPEAAPCGGPSPPTVQLNDKTGAQYYTSGSIP